MADRRGPHRGPRGPMGPKPHQSLPGARDARTLVRDWRPGQPLGQGGGGSRQVSATVEVTGPSPRQRRDQTSTTAQPSLGRFPPTRTRWVPAQHTGLQPAAGSGMNQRAWARTLAGNRQRLDLPPGLGNRLQASEPQGARAHRTPSRSLARSRLPSNPPEQPNPAGQGSPRRRRRRRRGYPMSPRGEPMG